MTEYVLAERAVSLAEQVYQQLASGILEGRYSPGQRLNIRALAEATGVSQTPVREALARLTAEGVLRMGTRSIEVPLVSSDNFEEIFRLRLALEGDLAERAASSLTSELIAAQERIQSVMDTAMAQQDFKEGLRQNVRFHFNLYRAAEQPITLQLVEKLWLLTGPSMNLLYPSLATARSPRHSSILDAMRAGNAARLRRAVEEDIITAREKILDLLRERDHKALQSVAVLAPRRPVGRPRKLATG
jgi:GntR family transcriptional regulator, colanic acid and biofilm gene transcriptional regulator